VSAPVSVDFISRPSVRWRNQAQSTAPPHTPFVWVCTFVWKVPLHPWPLIRYDYIITVNTPCTTLHMLP
jgi:hypothetical protein